MLWVFQKFYLTMIQSSPKGHNDFLWCFVKELNLLKLEEGRVLGSLQMVATYEHYVFLESATIGGAVAHV